MKSVIARNVVNKMNNRKDTFIIIRVEKKVKVELERLAGGSRKLSEFIRRHLDKLMNG